MERVFAEAQLALLITVLGVVLLVGTLGGRSFWPILLVLLASASIFQEPLYLLTTLLFALLPLLYSWVLWSTEREVFPKERVKKAAALAKELGEKLGPGWWVEATKVLWEESSPLRIRVWGLGWRVTNGKEEVIVAPHEVELKEGGKYWLPSLPRFLSRHIHEKGVLWMPFATFREEGVYPLHGGYLVVGSLPIDGVRAQVLALKAARTENGLSERLAKRLEDRGLKAKPLPTVYLGDHPSKGALWVDETLVLIFTENAFVPVNAEGDLPYPIFIVKWWEKAKEERSRVIHEGGSVSLIQVEGGEELLAEVIEKALTRAKIAGKGG